MVKKELQQQKQLGVSQINQIRELALQLRAAQQQQQQARDGEPEERMSWRVPKHSTPTKSVGDLFPEQKAELELQAITLGQQQRDNWHNAVREQRSAVCAEFRRYVDELNRVMTSHGLRQVGSTNQPPMVSKLARVKQVELCIHTAHYADCADSCGSDCWH